MELISALEAVGELASDQWLWLEASEASRAAVPVLPGSRRPRATGLLPCVLPGTGHSGHATVDQELPGEWSADILKSPNGRHI